MKKTAKNQVSLFAFTEPEQTKSEEKNVSHAGQKPLGSPGKGLLACYVPKRNAIFQKTKFFKEDKNDTIWLNADYYRYIRLNGFITGFKSKKSGIETFRHLPKTSRCMPMDFRFNLTRLFLKNKNRRGSSEAE